MLFRSEANSEQGGHYPADHERRKSNSVDSAGVASAGGKNTAFIGGDGNTGVDPSQQMLNDVKTHGVIPLTRWPS